LDVIGQVIARTPVSQYIAGVEKTMVARKKKAG
jgi:hypothetical protein